jgi:hypothetical protein
MKIFYGLYSTIDAWETKTWEGKVVGYKHKETREKAIELAQNNPIKLYKISGQEARKVLMVHPKDKIILNDKNEVIVQRVEVEKKKRGRPRKNDF